MKMTLTCSCGEETSYKTDKASPDEFIDNLFRKRHAGEGHEVTEHPGKYLGDEEERAWPLKS